MFSENDVRKDAIARFRAGLTLYLGSAFVYTAAGLVILYNGDIRLDGTPSSALLNGMALILFACISAAMFLLGKKYIREEMPSESLGGISSAALFYTLMGIPFALGFGAIFFFLVFQRSKEPEPKGNICPYCGGYIVLDPATGEAYCIGCGKRF